MNKFLSLLLTLALTLSVCAVPAFAVEDADASGDVAAVEELEARDTSFFTSQPHTDLNYDELEYQYIDPVPLFNEVSALELFAQDEENLEAFQQRFLGLKNGIYRMYAMYQLLSNMTSADSKNTWAVEESAAVYEDLLSLFDAFDGLVRDVLLLDNACSDYLASQLSEEDIEDYLDYENMTEEELALSSREHALESEYESKVVDTYSVTVDGVEYTDDSAYAAYAAGEIDRAAYTAISRAIAKEENAVLGEVYLEMIDVRNQIAKLNGYDNYAEYAYPEVYDRDYSIEDIEEFSTAVKEYLVPEFWAYVDFLDSPDPSELPENIAYSGVGMFDTLFPYFAQLSDELLESAQYTYDHGAYDVDPAPNKTGTAYSTIISYYNMPFYFNNAGGSYSDLLTTIHELGHNNNAYWSPNDWNDPATTIDVAEVHSQALELLMIHFYPELFDTQADAIADNTVVNILYSVIQGCLHDELQRYAYSTPNVTLQQINQEYRKICGEYGVVDASDERTEMYGWYEVPHTFTSPMYYISYATSAAGAFTFWEESQNDYFGAVDHYLRFTAQSNALGFQDSFLEADMDSPLSAAYIEKLSDTVHERLMLLDPYTDVYYDDWYAVSVYYVTLLSLMDGADNGVFAPNDTVTREQFLTFLARFFDDREDAEEPYTATESVIWGLENEIVDVDDLSAPLTREELAVMLCNCADLLGLDFETEGDLSDYTDADVVSPQAQDALLWAVELGLVDGMGDDTLNPQGLPTRAEIATVMFRLLMLVWQ